ncbi:hypothetical protein [Sphingobacterium lumbrici]|uniref:hypothetical protein n=1 Tax=Sphingobacterium lumbrici TaxID=2559600 RepID=UPI001C114B5D|nr:hypothetical protein [Sphingobacterium lumbrici]
MAKEIKTISDNLTALEHYYEKQDIATRECLLALKSMFYPLTAILFICGNTEYLFSLTTVLILVFCEYTERKLLSVSLKTKRVFSEQKTA